MSEKLTWPEEQELEERLKIEPEFKDLRQYILDLMWEGLCVGEVTRATNLTGYIVTGILLSQIESHDTLRREAV
jgi:hypothetical protein